MDTNTLLILAVLIIGFIAVIYFLRKKPESPKEDGQAMAMLLNQMNEMRNTVDKKLGESHTFVQNQFGQSQKIIKEITQELTRVNEGNKQVMNITDQLRSLQDTLTNTKQRGMLGEYSLEVILDNYFPQSYERQYKFKNGDIVDFIIRVKDKLIPIDSKFSLDNYQRILEAKTDAERNQFEEIFKSDLKKRIDETSKYIKPNEGTMDFAFMFIPAEAIYYDLLINRIGAVKSNTRDLVEYAMGEKHVVIVSPTSFLAYLQTVLQGLKALQIEESAKEIGKRVEELRRHISNYDTYMGKLGTQLGTSVRTYNTAYKEFGKIDKDVLRITGEAAGIEPMVLEGPENNSDEDE
ncbi:MAG: DNA recombination protein RmuC [Minisyncoccia bacterium]|jgi:DNA recombination protein RmuC